MNISPVEKIETKLPTTAIETIIDNVSKQIGQATYETLEMDTGETYTLKMGSEIFKISPDSNCVLLNNNEVKPVLSFIDPKFSRSDDPNIISEMNFSDQCLWGKARAQLTSIKEAINSEKENFIKIILSDDPNNPKRNEILHIDGWQSEDGKEFSKIIGNVEIIINEKDQCFIRTPFFAGLHPLDSQKEKIQKFCEDFCTTRLNKQDEIIKVLKQLSEDTVQISELFKNASKTSRSGERDAKSWIKNSHITDDKGNEYEIQCTFLRNRIPSENFKNVASYGGQIVTTFLGTPLVMNLSPDMVESAYNKSNKQD